MSESLIARELSCVLAGRSVLDRVSVEVRSGEIVGLLGPNGAGKTTLFRLLVGALRPAGGRVLLGSLDLTRLPMHRRALAGLGYLPQRPSAFSGLTVRQNIEAVLELERPRPAGEAAAARIDEALEIFALAPLQARAAAKLSGGERRRLELARLLVRRPRFLMLDEPFAGLDRSASDALASQIRRLGEGGAGVLLSDHRVEQTLTICHRASILVAGQIAVTGSAEEVARDPAARGAILGPNVPVSRSRSWH